MIYKQKGQEITIFLNQNLPYQTHIKTLREYTLSVDFTVKGKNIKFNRETGESIPKSNLTIKPDIRCKACFSWDMDDTRVKFKRLDKYERRRVTKYGHVCEACGYLNTE